VLLLRRLLKVWVRKDCCHPSATDTLWDVSPAPAFSEFLFLALFSRSSESACSVYRFRRSLGCLLRRVFMLFPSQMTPFLKPRLQSRPFPLSPLPPMASTFPLRAFLSAKGTGRFRCDPTSVHLGRSSASVSSPHQKTFVDPSLLPVSGP